MVGPGAEQGRSDRSLLLGGGLERTVRASTSQCPTKTSTELGKETTVGLGTTGNPGVWTVPYSDTH